MEHGTEHMIHVLPTFDEHKARITTVLSDNGREFYGREDRHPYELFLQLEGIEHRTTKVRRPQSNGYVERLHRTLLDEHFRIMGRKKFFESVEEMQKDLDAYLEIYNTKRPHQGRLMNGRTPARAFTDGLPKPEKSPQTEVAKKPKNRLNLLSRREPRCQVITVTVQFSNSITASRPKQFCQL